MRRASAMCASLSRTPASSRCAGRAAALAGSVARLAIGAKRSAGGSAVAQKPTQAVRTSLSQQRGVSGSGGLVVGLTYDMREDYEGLGYTAEELGEFDSAETIGALESAIRSHGFRTERIGHAKALVDALAAGRRWDLVFNFAEGTHGIWREALVPALLGHYRIPHTFSPAEVMVLVHNKGWAKTAVSNAGLPTARFAVIKDVAELEGVDLRYPLFAKPVAEGSSKGVWDASHVQTPGQLQQITRELLRRFRQPVLVEEFLPGREFTVGVAGGGADARVLGITEVTLSQSHLKANTYESKVKDWDGHVVPTDRVAGEACEVALASWRALGCLDAGRVDIRCDAAGVPNFIEVNPIPGLTPGVSHLVVLCQLHGLNYEGLVGQILASALRRHGLENEPSYRLDGAGAAWSFPPLATERVAAL